jgi:hypothetical protein
VSFADEHYTASVLLGVVPPERLPGDEKLRAIVGAVKVAGPSVAAVLPVLRELDPDWHWGAHVTYLLESWDERVERAKAIAPLMLFQEFANQAVSELRRAENEIAAIVEVVDSAKETLNMLAGWVTA